MLCRRLELLCVLVSVAAGVGATLGLPAYLSDIINRGIADKDMNYILHTGLIMLGIAVLGMVCNIITGFFASRQAFTQARCWGWIVPTYTASTFSSLTNSS